MRILLAPDAFKGSLSAHEVAVSLSAGLESALPAADVRAVPMADGGEGTVDALVRATGGERVRARVTSPLGKAVEAEFGVLGDGETAVIEMAAASGLMLVPESKRDPRVTTSRGTGELIRAALARGCRRLIVGIGGSATNDGGAGMAQALGARLLDADGRDLPDGGAGLASLDRIDTSELDSRLRRADITVACDVDNPLVGARGASSVYGPQKGASAEVAAQLDASLRRYAEVVARDLGQPVADLPGAGAGGGLSAGLIAFAGARMRPGIELVMEACDLASAIRGVEVVITGEGRIDGQTAHGKVPLGVARLSRRHGKPVIAVAGSFTPEAEALVGPYFDAIFSPVEGPITLEAAMRGAGQRLTRLGRQIGALLQLGARVGKDCEGMAGHGECH